jgi:hypothetical protein
MVPCSTGAAPVARSFIEAGCFPFLLKYLLS